MISSNLAVAVHFPAAACRRREIDKALSLALVRARAGKLEDEREWDVFFCGRRNSRILEYEGCAAVQRERERDKASVCRYIGRERARERANSRWNNIGAQAALSTPPSFGYTRRERELNHAAIVARAASLAQSSLDIYMCVCEGMCGVESW